MTNDIRKKQEEMMRASADTPRKKMLLHSCCGPCSTAVLEQLIPVFDIDVFFYNPNIQPPAEYEKRLTAQKEVLKKIGSPSKISLIVPPYDTSEFENEIRGFENEPEGSERCVKCMALRIRKTAEYAAANGYDLFCTTLSVSPHKSAPLLYELSEKYSKQFHIPFLPADFKKKNGFFRSVQLSKEYGIYRQEYCGCLYAK